MDLITGNADEAYGIAESRRLARGQSRNIAERFGGFAVDSNNWIPGRPVA
jgi:hypothetical protein